MKQILMEPKVEQDNQKKTVIKNNNPKIESKEETVKEKALSDLPGVGPATIEKLEAVGYNDLMSVAVATPGELIDATGMVQAAAKKLHRSIQESSRSRRYTMSSPSTPGRSY